MFTSKFTIDRADTGARRADTGAGWADSGVGRADTGAAREDSGVRRADTASARADSVVRRAEIGPVDVLIPLIRAAATISFALAPCSLGFIIIAVSEQLIRSILVGDDPEMLLSDLQNQFPHAELEFNETYDAGLVAKVVDLIEHPDEASDLPLEIRGTDFQVRVWDALKNVPAGTTASYTFLAEQIGARDTSAQRCEHAC
jgi:O6-methylguanine-DNA--protein-cysteine methyltransferase